jgi:tetratricopeptide (TPR) repeat protein
MNKILKSFTLLLVSAFILGAGQLNGQEAKTASGLYNDGLALLKEKNYADALTTMKEALAKAEADGNEKVIDLAKKNGAVAAYSYGNTKRKANAMDEAMSLYAQGIELNPAYSSNYIGKARAEAGKGMAEQAMTSYMKAIEIATAEGKTKKVDEAKKRAKSLVTSAYNEKKDAEVVSLGKAFLAGSDNPDVHYYIGKSLMNQDQHSDAVTHFDKALVNPPAKKDRIIYAKAQSLEKLGKKSDAVAAYKMITDEKYKANAAHKISTLK